MTLFVAAGKLSAKVLQRLLEKDCYQVSEGWRKGLSSDAKGKETLLQLEWERFSFYLADGADFSMRRAGLTQRQRQHCISEILAIMERAEILMDRSKNNQSLKISRCSQASFRRMLFFIKGGKGAGRFHKENHQLQNDRCFAFAGRSMAFLLYAGGSIQVV